MQDFATHLRDKLDHLPSAPGVYIFHGREGDLPVYIGKSINIRSRVLSHLRTEDEATMLRQTQRISFERTAGEVGALLLESHLIKTQHPLFNQRLRRTRQLCSWHVTSTVPELVYARDVNFAQQGQLFGLFTSRRSAEERLMGLADEQGLCYGVLGLEKLSQGKPCFRAQLRQCAGACCGRESLQDHHTRLLAALADLQVITWPHAGAVALHEQHEDMQAYHVVRNWCHLGTVDDLTQAKALDQVNAGFDADAYKILVKPLLEAQHNGQTTLIAL